jgi:hypothetical protein
MTIKVFSDFSGYGGRRVAIAEVNANGDIIGIVEPLTIKRIEPDPATMVLDDTFRGPMAEQFLQSALEEAWRVGLRPKNWRVETTEQVAAMDNHLQDMRRLVFKTEPAS